MSSGPGRVSWWVVDAATEPVVVGDDAPDRELGTRIGGQHVLELRQDLALCGNLDVTSNIFLGRELTGSVLVDDGQMEQVARRLLRDLTSRIPSVRTPVSELSAGQRQAVAIARTLIGEPRLVVLDEPTAALSVAQTAEVLTYIERLRELGHGVILISHNMNDVRAVSDRIVVLRHGRNNGFFDAATASYESILAAITGATSADDEVLRRIAAYR